MNKIFLIFLLIFFYNAIYAQKKYEGIVIDESGSTIDYAKLVSIKEKKCWITNIDGKYRFFAGDSLEIFANFIGYPMTKYRLFGRDTIILKPHDFSKMKIHYLGFSCNRFFSFHDVLNQKEFKEYIECKIANHLIRVCSRQELSLNYYDAFLNTGNFVNFNREKNILKRTDKEINKDLIIYNLYKDKFLNLGNTIFIDSLKSDLYELYLLDLGNKDVEDLNKFKILKKNYPIGIININKD